ncbi:hypothetical protein VFPFJ_00735 [Purpureocillium lilacinum]|uniref:Uncharacterized protein n=1 Tax=Purpureocillium lilacinum TaxID=33203 RepID=A0A179H925_PURLI|nr:hypothetical protein VFPFJ_00735 [Purpureocillium lilacinum]OAQ86664.1 hypothetical protein VFPBJ_00704 [Purpureocillium lilacinum]OAQ94626.1 hypothetical protein VFPFJ_00735 [Purpureocillium lilacinum]
MEKRALSAGMALGTTACSAMQGHFHDSSRNANTRTGGGRGGQPGSRAGSAETRGPKARSWTFEAIATVRCGRSKRRRRANAPTLPAIARLLLEQNGSFALPGSLWRGPGGWEQRGQESPMERKIGEERLPGLGIRARARCTQDLDLGRFSIAMCSYQGDCGPPMMQEVVKCGEDPGACRCGSRAPKRSPFVCLCG